MTGDEDLIAETITVIGHQGDPIQAYFARPTGPGPFPGVVVCHRIKGWDSFPKEVTRRLAVEGFAAICPNLFTREAPKASPDDASMIVKKQGGVPDDQAVGDTFGAAEYLRLHPSGNGRAGIIGHGLGGRQVYLSVCQLEFDAAIIAYGNSIATPFNPGRFCEVGPDVLAAKHPVLPIDLTKNLHAPLLAVFGRDDPNATPNDVRRLEEELKLHEKHYQFHVYDAGHEFMNPAETTYRVEPANDAWAKFVEFFGQHL